MSTHYETLGIVKAASAKQIKASYRSLVKIYHPDRFAEGSKTHAEAAKRIREINAAYAVLSKPLFHWSSGLPFSVLNGNGWPTNYDLTGEAIEVGNPGKIGAHRDALGNPTMFQNRDAALAAFRDPFPGEGGQRNELRGPGYFGIDMGLDKDWKIREGQTLSFAWEAFNITNSVRFDAAAPSNSFDLTTVPNFGVYSSTLAQPRVMQFMLRYSF